MFSSFKEYRRVFTKSQSISFSTTTHHHVNVVSAAHTTSVVGTTRQPSVKYSFNSLWKLYAMELYKLICFVFFIVLIAYRRQRHKSTPFFKNQVLDYQALAALWPQKNKFATGNAGEKVREDTEGN